MSVRDPDHELLCGAGVADGRRRPYSREKRKHGNGSKAFHFSSHLILVMAGTVTRILCKCNFPCDKGVEWPDRNSELRLPSGRRSSARLTRRRGSRLMASGNPHRKSVHFEV